MLVRSAEGSNEESENLLSMRQCMLKSHHMQFLHGASLATTGARCCIRIEQRKGFPSYLGTSAHV